MKTTRASEYVVLKEDTLCLRVAVLSSKTIPGTAIRRLKLKVFEGSSPTRDTGEKDEDKERQFALPVGVNVGEKSGPTSVSIEEPCSSMKSKNMSEKTKDIMNLELEPAVAQACVRSRKNIVNSILKGDYQRDRISAKYCRTPI